MKKNIYILLLFFGLPIYLFSQGNTIQKLQETWNADAGKWDFQQVDNWEYDHAGREVFFSHEDIFINDYIPEDHRSTKTTYDANGNLTLQINRTWTDSTWTEYRVVNKYDQQNRLVENKNKQDYFYGMESYYTSENRTTYEYNETENTKTQRYYIFIESPSEWSLQGMNKQFFNENDCEILSEETNFFSDGSIHSKRKTVYERAADCQILEQSLAFQSQNENSLVWQNRTIYTYTDNGKTTRYTNQQYNRDTQEWKDSHFTESTVDEEGRLLRNYLEYTGWEYWKKILTIFTYTNHGELATRREYQTYLAQGFDDFKLTSLDSFKYEYNGLGQLATKRQFAEYHYYQFEPVSHFSSRNLIKYTYYCDGQLKTETHENLPNLLRITYEYDKSGECDLTETASKILVFPNPSDGNIEIRNNMLATSEATIRVFSTIGQEVFQQKIGKVTERFSLDISHLPSGHYVISVINGKKVVSEKIQILK